MRRSTLTHTSLPAFQLPQGTPPSTTGPCGQNTLLPPAPMGPMSWWGRFNDLTHNVRELVRLLSQNPTFYPWIDSPPDAQSFDETAVIPVPVAIGVETTVLTLPVPVGWDGCILSISNVYLGPVESLNYAIPSLVWRVRVDQRQVNGYNKIATQFGTTEFPRPISPILVNSGQVLRYTVTNNDAALPAVGNFIYCQFGGRFWPHRKS
jgi:hypothetical protein